jgi:hypothetical protein
MCCGRWYTCYILLQSGHPSHNGNP